MVFIYIITFFIYFILFIFYINYLYCFICSNYYYFLLTFPVTYTSVKQSFSNLKLIMNDRQSLLNQDKCDVWLLVLESRKVEKQKIKNDKRKVFPFPHAKA